MELKSVKTQSDTTEKRFENRLNQIENRFTHLESHQNKPDDDYYYGPDY